MPQLQFKPIGIAVTDGNWKHQSRRYGVCDHNSTKCRKTNEPQDLIITDNELERRLIGGKNINIVKCEKKADKAFRQFLLANGCNDTEYWCFEEPELDNYLAKF